jgi:hypothetical protein
MPPKSNQDLPTKEAGLFRQLVKQYEVTVSLKVLTPGTPCPACDRCLPSFAAQWLPPLAEHNCSCHH